jgi:hypothetical protein
MNTTNDVNNPPAANPNFGMQVREDASFAEPDTVKALEAEAAAARQAMAADFHRLAMSLQTAADPREWTRRHPWAAMGVAVATGYAAAHTATAAPRMASYTPAPGPSPMQMAGQTAQAPGSTITALLFDLAKVAFTSHVIPWIQAWQQASAEGAAAAQGSTGNGAAHGSQAPGSQGAGPQAAGSAAPHTPDHRTTSGRGPGDSF